MYVHCRKANATSLILASDLQVSVSLLNISSSHPNLTVDLNVNPATGIDAGEYFCMTTSADKVYSNTQRVKVIVTGKILINTTVLFAVTAFHSVYLHPYLFSFIYDYINRPHQNN